MPNQQSHNKMNRFKACLVLPLLEVALFVSSFGCAAAQDSATNITEGFTVDLPRGLSIEKTQRVDFVVYRISNRGKAVAFIYVGNHPDFPGKTPDRALVQTSLKTRDFECRTLW